MAGNAKLQDSIDNLKKAIDALNKTINKQTSSGGSGGKGGSGGGTGTGGSDIGSLYGTKDSFYGSRINKEQASLLSKYSGAGSNNSFAQIGQLLRESQQLQSIANKKTAGGKGYYNAAATSTASQGAASAKASAISIIGNEANKAIDNTVGYLLAAQKAYYEIHVRNIKVDREILSRRINLYGDALKKANDVAVSKLTGDITEGAYSAFRNMIDFGKNSINTSYENMLANRTRQLDNAITRWQAVNNTVGKAMGDAAGVLTQVPHPVTAIIGTALNTIKGALNATTELEIMKREQEKQLLDQATELRKQLNEKVFSFAEPMIKLTESIDKMLITLNEKGYQSARMMGFNADASAEYARGIASANEAMSKIGKTYEDMLKAQNAYITESGRNTLISTANALNVSSLSMLYGIDENETGGIMGAMNVFNKSIEDGSDLMFTMYKTANKMGVSNQKFAKDLQSTLKLAERYQFKGGVKGVMEMAAWAQKIRLNMEEVSGVLSKMHTGNIEDVITTAARMNVLGGNAALYSDPMAMLFNAYSDPQKYMENLNKTIRNFGTVDRVTGETKFNIAEQMRIEQIANTMGVSVESLMNQARQANKADVISKKYGNRFGEYSDYVTQNALWSEEKRAFVINVMDENGRAKEKTLDELSQSDLQNIFPQDTQETLVEYTRRIMNVVEKKRGVESEIKGRQMNNVYDEWEQTKMKEYELTLKEFNDYEELFTANTLDGFKYLITSQEMQYKLMGKMNEQFKKTGVTMLGLVSEMSNKEFQKSTENFGQLVAAFNNEDAFIEYIRTVNPDLADALEETHSRFAADDVISLYSKKTEEEILKERKDMLGSEAWANLYGRYLGINMPENMLDELGTNGSERDRSKARFALRAGIIVPVTENGVTRFYWGEGTGHEGQLVEDIAPLDLAEQQRRNEENARALAAGATGGNPLGWYDKDVILTPEGPHFTDPNDLIMAFKPGGPIAQGLGATNGFSNNSARKLEISGTLRLDMGSQSIDLLELVRNNPNSLRRLTEEILIEANKTKYGGRAEYSPNRFTL